jgi:hypothetical protein
MSYERIYFVQPVAVPWKELAQREQFFRAAQWLIERVDSHTVKLTERSSGEVLEVSGVGFSVWAKVQPKATTTKRGPSAAA